MLWKWRARPLMRSSRGRPAPTGEGASPSARRWDEERGRSGAAGHEGPRPAPRLEVRMQAGQPELRVYEVPTGELVPYAGNAKEHPDWQVGQIVASIERFGFSDPVGVWHDAEGRPVIVEGHGRVMAAKELGMASVPCVALDHLDDEGRRAYALAHNQLTMNSGWDDLALSDELADLADMDMGDFGFDAPADGAGEYDDGIEHATLRDRFGWPPFSVLNVGSGDWQARKRSWLALGIRSEIGRGGSLAFSEPGAVIRGRFRGGGGSQQITPPAEQEGQ